MGTKGKSWNWSEESREAHSKQCKERVAGKTVGKPFQKKHGLGGTPIYNIWKKMMYRCYRETNPDYPHYGARGISVCERWHDVTNFHEDMGDKPEKASIERIDVNGNYEPGNCTWLPHRFQSKNRRPWKHSPEGLERIREARRSSST